MNEWMKTRRMDCALGVALLLALTGLTAAYPTEQCAAYCRDSGKTRFDVGYHYTYNYNAETISKVGGIEELDSQSATLNISATVDIHVLTPCEYSLQVRRVRLNNVERSGFSAAIERSPLRFWSHDGAIKRICPPIGEPEWVLNIKRGILSIMQNSMEDLQEHTVKYETDILGTCQTYYDPLFSSESGFSVVKTKDLQKCSNHAVTRSENAIPLKKSITLLRGGYKCFQSFTASGWIQAAQCSETQLFQPFSNGDSGAKTVITSSLSFRERLDFDPSTPADKIGPFSTLKYQTTDPSLEVMDDESDESTVFSRMNNILQNLQKSFVNGISSDFPQYFNQLISELQQLDSASLENVISSSLDSDEIDHKILIEALTQVKTDESLAAIDNLYFSGHLSENEMDAVFSMMPYLKSPTLRTISTLTHLISNSALDKSKMMLPASSTIHSFCRNNFDCRQNEDIQLLMKWIEVPLGGSCSANSAQRQDEIIIALKAIGNAGFISNIEILKSCFESSDNAVKIRLAAIDALRRMDCNMVRSSKVLHIYSELKENPEVRIAAYLASMRCPSDFLFTLVKNTLLVENTNQVGSFVWTHLENLNKKHSPYQHLIRSIIAKSQLKNKFNTDARRFSRNYAGTTYFDSINVGSAVDANVVFSPESYLPRSLGLNLTVDVFGESVNLFDFGARLEGFESIVEGIFDPDGYYPDKNIRSMLKNLKVQSSFEENEISELSDTFMSSRTLLKSPQGLIYSRVLGNEVYLKQFDSVKEVINLSDEFDDILRKLLQSQVDFSKSTRFLDLSYECPTSIGLPLKLKINGTAALKFQSSVQSSLENFFKPNSAAYIKLFFNPSAVVQINGEITMDAVVDSVGLYSSSELHTNSYLDLEIDFDSAKVLDVKLNFPRQESDIFSVSSKLFTMENGVKTEVDGITEDSEEWEYCTPDKLSKAVGFQACSKLRYANASQFDNAPYFPLTGPFEFSTQLQKFDNFTAYHLKYQNQRSDVSPSANGAVIFFDTPGSKVERQFEVSYFVDSNDGLIRFNAQAEYHNTSLAVLDCSLARKSGAESAQQNYDFNWDVKLLEFPHIHGKGNMYYQVGGKYVGSSVELHGITNKPLSANVNLALLDFTKNFVFNVASGEDNILNIGGNLKTLPSRVDSKFSLTYSLPGKRSENIRVSYLWANVMKSVSWKDKMQLSVKSSEFPAYNSKIVWTLIRGQNFFDMNTTLGIGGSDWQSRQFYRNWRTAAGHVYFTVEASLANPSKNLDYSLELDYQMKAKQVDLKFLAQLNELQKISLDASYDKKSTFDRNFDLTVLSPWNKGALSASLVSQNLGQSSDKEELSPQTGSAIPDYMTLYVKGNWTTGNSKTQHLQIDGGYKSLLFNKVLGENYHTFYLTIKLPEAVSDRNPLNFKYSIDTFKQPRYVKLDASFKDYGASYTLVSRSQGDLSIKFHLQTPFKKYTGEIKGDSLDDESHLVMDLNLSKCIHFEFNQKNASGKQEIDGKLFWDYNGNRNKTIGIYLYNSEAEKIGKLYLEQLFMGLKMKLTSEKQENSLQHNFLFSTSWGESEQNISGELKLDGHLLDHKFQHLNSDLGKNTTRQELTLSTSIVTPVKNFELQWIDLIHVKEISEESFVADSSFFWTLTSTKVSLSWHEMSDPLLEGQGLDYFGSERLGPQYFTRPDSAHNDNSPSAWIERKLGAKVETIFSNHKTAANFLYFNDYSDLTAVDVSFNYTSDDNGLKTSLDSTYNYAMPLLHMDLSKNQTESRLNFKFTSPTKALTSFTSNLVMASSLNYAIFETKWEPNKNITFWYSIDLPNYIGTEFMSPFKNYKLFTFQFKSKDSTDILTTTSRREAEITAQFNDQKAAASFLGKSRDSGFDGSLMLLCPTKLDTLHIFISHDWDDVKFSEKFSVKSGSSKQTVVEASIDFRFQDYADFAVKTDFATTNSVLLLEIVNKFESQGMNCSLNGKWNKEHILLKLNGEYINEIDETLVQCQFSMSGSPFRKDYDIMFQHSHNDLEYDSLIILPFGMKLEHSLLLQNLLNWKNSILMKSSSKSLSIANEQNYNTSWFGHSMITEISGQRSSLDVNLHFDDDDSTLKNCSLLVITPWSHPINAKYNFFKAFKTVVLDSGEKSLLFSDHSLTLQYQNNKEISVKASGHAATALNFVYDVVFSSPYHNNSHVTVKCDWAQPLKVAWAVFRHNQHVYETRFAYLRQGLVMNSSLTFSQNSTQISVSQLNFNLASSNMHAELFTMFRNKKYNILFESQLQENKCKAQLVLNSPFDQWKKLIISLDYDTSKNVKMAVVNYEKNADSASLSATFMQTWSSMKASAALSTNFLGKTQIYSLAGECDYLSSDDLTASLNYIHNDETSKFSGKWRNKRDEKAAQLEVTSPYKGFRVMSGSFSLLNQTQDLSLDFSVGINEFKLTSGMQIDARKQNYSSFFTLSGLPNSKDFSTSFHFLKDDSYLFTADAASGGNFVKMQGSLIQTGIQSQLMMNVNSSIKNYEHSYLTVALRYPYPNSTEHHVQAELFLSNNLCTFNAEYNPNNKGFREGRFNVSFPKSWKIVDMSGLYNISQFLEDQLSAEMYLQVGESVNKFSFSGSANQAALQTFLDLPILKRNLINANMTRFADASENNYQFFFNMMDDSMTEIYFNSSVKISQTELLLTCTSSFSEFQTVLLHSNLQEKVPFVSFKRNNNSVDVILVYNGFNSVNFSMKIRDQFLGNWDASGVLSTDKLKLTEKSLIFIVEKENAVCLKLDSHFNLSRSKPALMLHLFLFESLSSRLDVNFNFENLPSVSFLFSFNNETKLVLKAETNSDLTGGKFHFKCTTNLLPHPHQNTTFDLWVTPKGDVTTFTYTRVNQKTSKTRSGFFAFSLLRSVILIENPRSSETLKFHLDYNFKGVNKSISLHARNGTKFLDLDGSVLTGPSSFDLKLLRVSDKKRSTLNAKCNVSEGMDLLFSFAANSTDLFKLKVFVDSFSKVDAIFSTSLSLLKSLPSLVELNYDLTQQKKVFVVSAKHKGSSHVINTMIDKGDFDGHLALNVSSPLLPGVRKISFASNYNFSDFSKVEFNSVMAADSLKGNFSLKSNLESTLFISILAVSSVKNHKSFPMGIDLSADFSIDNKTVTLSVSNPGQNVKDDYSAHLYFQNLTAENRLIWKRNDEMRFMTSLSYDFSSKREFAFSQKKDLEPLQELNFNLTKVQNGSVSLTNIWNITSFELSYDLLKIDSINLEMNYLSQKFNCQVSSSLLFAHSSLDSSLSFLWNNTGTDSAVSLQEPFKLKSRTQLSFDVKKSFVRSVLSISEMDYFNLSYSHNLIGPEEFGMSDVIDLLLYQGTGGPGLVKSEIALSEKFWSTDLKVDAELRVNQITADLDSDLLGSSLKFNVNMGGEPKIVGALTFNYNESLNRFASIIHYQSEYNHKFSIQVNSTGAQPSKEIYSSFSWDDDVLFLNFTFDLNIDRSTINAAVKSSHFQDMSVMLNYDIRSESKLARLATKVGSSVYVLKAQSTSTPTNQTLQLRFKSPIEGYSLLLLSAELSSFVDGTLVREKFGTSLVKETFETKIDASFEVDSDPENPKFSVLVSGNNILEWNGKVRNWLISLRSERIPVMNIAIKISKWKPEAELETKKNVLMQLKGSPESMNLLIDFPDVSKSIKVNYLLAFNKTQKSMNFNFLRGKEKMFTMTGLVNFDKVGVTSFEVKGYCHPIGTYEYSGIYKNRGKQSIILTLKHNEQVNEIEGHFRYTIRSSYFDLEFESSLNNQRRMHVKGSYDFNDPSVKSASLYISWNNHELKAKFGGRVTAKVVSAEMLILSTIKAVENINVKFELTSPSSKENNISLAAHVNDADYKLNCNVLIEKFNVTGNLNVIFPSFILKDLKYEVSLQEQTFRMKIGHSGEELTSVMLAYDLTSQELLYLTFDAYQQILPFSSGYYSGGIVVGPQAGTGFAYLSKRQSKNNVDLLEEGDSYFAIQGRISRQSKALNVTLKYGNETDEIILNYINPDFSQSIWQRRLFVEVKLPSLSQNATKIDFSLSGSPISPENDSLRWDLDLESPFKFLSKLSNHLHFGISPTSRKFNFLLKLSGDIVEKDNIIRLDFNFDSVTKSIDLLILEEFLCFEVPTIKFNGSCKYDLWKELKMNSNITINELLYSYEGSCKLDNEFHATVTSETPSHVLTLKFGGHSIETDTSSLKMFYVVTPSYQLTYTSDFTINSLNKFLFISLPGYELTATFSGLTSASLKHIFDYSFFTPTHKYLGSFNLVDNSFKVQLSSKEPLNISECSHHNDSSSSCSIANLKVGLLSVSFDEASSQYSFEASMTESEDMFEAPLKIKHLTGLSVNVTNSDEEVSLKSRVNFKRIRNKPVEIVFKKNWDTLQITVLDEVSLELHLRKHRKRPETELSWGSFNLQVFNVSHKLDWACFPAVERFHLNVKFEFYPHAQPTKILKMSLLIKNNSTHKVGTSGKFSFSKENTNVIVNYNNGYINIESSSKLGQIAFSSFIENHSDKIFFVALFNIDENKHMVSFMHQKSLPLDSWSTIVSPLLPVEMLKISIKSENLTILFNVITKNSTVKPDLFVKFGVIPQKGSAFLYYKNLLFSPLSSVTVDCECILEENSIRKLYLSSFVLYKNLPSEVVAAYASNGNQIVSSLNVQVPYQNLKDFQFSISLPLILTSHYNASFVLNVDKAMISSGSLILTHRINNDTTDYSADVDFWSSSHKSKTVLQITRQKDSLSHFAFSSNYKKSLVAVQYKKNTTGELTEQTFTVFWNMQKILDAKLGTNFNRDAFLLDSEMQVMLMSYVQKYAAKIQFLNKDEKKVALWLQHPSLNEGMGFTFAHRYDSIFNNTLLVHVDMPFINGFPVLSLNISNRIDVLQQSANVNYYARYNNSSVQFLVTGASNYPWYSFSLDALLDDSPLGGLVLAKSVSGLSFALTTPKEISDSLFIDYSPKESMLSVVTNSVHLLKLSYAIELPNLEPATWYNKPFLIQVTALNPMQPVHFRLSQTIILDFYETTLLVRYHLDTQDRLTGIGFTYSKTDSYRNLEVEMFDKQLRLTKEGSDDMLDYTAKFSLDNENAFGVRVMKGKPEEFSQNVGLLTLYLPGKVLSFSAFKSLPDDNGLDESSLGVAVASNDKKIALKYTTSTEEYSSTNELSFSHFALSHEVAIRIHCSPIVKRIQVIYSEDVVDMFTAELQTFDFEENGTNESSSSLIILHSATNLLFSVKLYSQENIWENKVGATISYHSLLTDSTRVFQIIREFNKTSSEMDLTVKSNLNQLKIGGGILADGFIAKVQTNHKEPLVFKMSTVNKREKQMELHYGDLRACRVYVGMPNNKKIVAEASMKLFDSEETDALFMLQLNSSRLLWGKILVPSVTLSAAKDIFEEYSDLPVVVEHIYLGFLELGQENFLAPFTVIPAKFADFLELLLLKTTHESRQVGESFEKVGKIGAVLLDTNQFYCKDIYNGLKSYVAVLEEEFSGFFKLVVEVVSSLKFAAKEFVLSIRQGFVLSHSRMSAVIEDIKDVSLSLKLVSMNLWNDIMRVNFNTRNFLESLVISLRHQLVIFERTVIYQIQILEEIVEQILLRFENYILTRGIVLQTYYDHFDESILQLEDKINGNLDALKDDLFRMEESQYLILLIERNYPWLSQNHLGNLIKKLKYFMDMITELVVEDLKSNFGEYINSIQTSMLTTIDRLENYINYPVFKNSFDFINRVYQKLVWLRKYHAISLKMQENVRRLVQTINSYANELEVALNPSAENSEEESEELNTVVNMDSNSIEFSQELPIDWDGFDTKPHFEQLQQTQNQDTASVELNSFNTHRHQILSGLYYGLMNIAADNASFSSLVPPFQAKGLLIGSQYFITFDGKVYNFSSTDCRYILAGDFKQNRAFITVNYVNQDGVPTKKSVSVMSHGTEIEINHLDRRVYVNGNVTELPFASRSITVTLDEPNRIVAKTVNGFIVDCNFYNDICSIQINGWMFGKTGGLLGTYDNEPANDFTLPNGTVVEQASVFASSWALRNCQNMTSELIPKSEHVAKSEVSKTIANCEFYFRSKISPFRSCFPKVNPEPFAELCNLGLRHPSFCSAAAAYLASCNMKSILNLPAECAYNESYSDSAEKSGVKIADATFVVEDHSCILGSELEYISSMLSNVFHTEYDLVNIAVVGFSGNAFPEPRIRTMNGKMWTQNPNLVKKTLSSDRRFWSDSPTTNAAIIDALKYSTNLQWHVNASRTVILILCQDLFTDYLELLPELTEKRINLQVIRMENTGSTKSTAQSSRISIPFHLIKTSDSYARTVMRSYLAAAYDSSSTRSVQSYHPWAKFEQDLDSFSEDSLSNEAASEESRLQNTPQVRSSSSTSISLSSPRPSIIRKATTEPPITTINLEDYDSDYSNYSNE
nr:PREDICTED: uncharacterized protein LOC109044421 isoform X1 [Bemisia tabaci]